MQTGPTPGRVAPMPAPVKPPKPPKPPKPARPTIHVPQPPPANVSPPGSASEGSPLDATYYNSIAGNEFKVNQAINALNLQGSQASTSLQDTLAQLAYAQPRAQLGLEQKYNRAGGLYSSGEAQGEGDLAHAYLGKQSAAQTKYGNTMSGIAGRIAALQGGIPIFDNAQAIAAAGRAATLAENSPAPAPPVTSSTTSAPATAPHPTTPRHPTHSPGHQLSMPARPTAATLVGLGVRPPVPIPGAQRAPRHGIARGISGKKGRR